MNSFLTLLIVYHENSIAHNAVVLRTNSSLGAYIRKLQSSPFLPVSHFIMTWTHLHVVQLEKLTYLER